jgi:hypothetical protein
MCGLPFWIRFGQADYNRYRIIEIHILILRLSWSWLKKEYRS